MESDLGKLFIGGISWDTDEERLKEYFGNYGEVVEAVIMRDRLTGRARGFGFVVFADPAIAERVTRDKHIIDGRTVEAKKAVPREDQHLLNRSIAISHGSPGPARTKKIFVGGLASNVTESEFKKYFDQFGNITDVVVMYDHNTQRPRGFGFITYDAEDAVDRVLLNTFHDLNGKMVEVKRAVPKELSQAPSRSPLIGYNYGLSRVNSFLNGYAQGYNMNSIGGYGARMDGRFSPIVPARGAFAPFGHSGYGIGMNMEQGLAPNIGANSSLGNSSSYGRMTSPHYTENSNRYNTPIGAAGSNRRTDSALSPNGRNLWGNGGFSSAANLGAYLGSENGSFGSFGNAGGNWGSLISAQDVSTSSSLTNGNMGFWAGDESFGLTGDGNERKNSVGVATGSSFVASADSFEETRGDLYRGSSVYSNSTWSPANQDIDGSGSFSYGLGNISSDATARGSESYIGSYNATARQPNRGIAA